MRSIPRITLLALGLVCMALTLAGRLLAEPARPSAQPPTAQKVTEQPETPDVPEGRELTPKELQIILEPIIRDAKAGVEAAKEMTAKDREKDSVGDKDKTGLISRVVQGTKKLIGSALSYAGVRYKWGGTSRSGIDCSGLTRILYLAEGIKLPHNAKEQFKLGQPVKTDDLLPGDLVFFNTRGPLTHVGMWIGNGKFIHAASRKRGVRVDSLSSAYYAKRFAGTRRYKDFAEMTASAAD